MSPGANSLAVLQEVKDTLDGLENTGQGEQNTQLWAYLIDIASAYQKGESWRVRDIVDVMSHSTDAHAARWARDVIRKYRLEYQEPPELY